jgi:hypothetical protein
MIVALTGMESNGAVADLAEDLAMLRVAAGKRVLLVSPNPGPYDPQLFDDLVIDASQSSEQRALARAAVIVVLMRPQELEQGSHQQLLARLRAAQEANPAAQMLVTVAHGRRPLSPHQAGCVLVFVAQLPHARLADTLVLDDGGDSYHSHHSELELDAYKADCKLCAPEVRHLYSQIFQNTENKYRYKTIELGKISSSP